MKTIDKYLNAGMRFLMAISMLALVVGGTWQIFSRWILGDPSTFTDEFLRYTLIWAGMIGTAYCFYQNQHIALDMVTSKVKGVPSIILSVFIEVMVVFFVVAIFIYGGAKLALGSTNASSVLHISFKVLYMILPISGVFIIIARILQYCQKFANRSGNGGQQ